MVEPSLTDRGKPGSKRHLLTDRNGTPLATVLTGVNVRDSRVFEDLLLDVIQPVKGPRGSPHRRLEKLHADKSYDFRRAARRYASGAVSSRITRKGKESSERLERTGGW